MLLYSHGVHILLLSAISYCSSPQLRYGIFVWSVIVWGGQRRETLTLFPTQHIVSFTRIGVHRGAAAQQKQ